MNAIQFEEIQNHFIEQNRDQVEYSFEKVRRSQNIKESWNSLVVSALEVAAEIDPLLPSLPDGTVIRAVDAVGWSMGRNFDIRPRLLDKSSGTQRLIDSGSQISVAKKGPDDKLDNSVKLVAVNGSKIETFGQKELVVKIGRKEYRMPAIICDVQQDILGMDFITKYRLNFEWDDFDQTELYLVDRKANIKSELQIVTVPKSTPRIDYIDASGAEPSRQPGEKLSSPVPPSPSRSLSPSSSQSYLPQAHGEDA